MSLQKKIATSGKENATAAVVQLGGKSSTLGNEKQTYLILDYETRSEADLKKLGACEYAKHPTTGILCAAWRVGTRSELKRQLDEKEPAHVWSPFIGGAYRHLINSMCNESIMIVAHNALFEQSITQYTLGGRINLGGECLAIPPERWVCTASLAASLALPRNLEGACLALGLTIQKDMEGRKLILKYCKPRKATKTNQAKWHNKLSDLKRLMQYCATDVDAETELFLRARPLIPFERKIWVLDQRINQRGFAIDSELVDSALQLIDEEMVALDKETFQITGGLIRSTKQRDGVLKFIRSAGVELDDVRAKTVSDTLKQKDLSPVARRILEIRQAASKSSTAKYVAFKRRAGSDRRVRDNLVYHAASTGRWSGAGVQPQNFPRGSIKDTATAI